MKSGITVCVLDKNQIYEQIYHAAHDNSYVSYIRGNRCKTEEDFFYEISASFQFPWYFGENWAAFDECICDLEWLDFQQLFIVIDDFSLVFGGDKKMQDILIKYLGIAVDYWNEKNIQISIWLNQ